MPFSPEEIESKQFRVTLRGYSKEEVDRFLQQLAEDHQAMLAAIGSGGVDLVSPARVDEDADEEMSMEQARAGDGGFDMLGHEIGRLLRMAGESADALRQKIEREATAARSGALEEARNLREDAVKTSHQIVTEAEKRALEIRADAERTANELIIDAKNQASELRNSAEREAQQRVREAEQRLGQLQEREAKLRQRLHQLETVVQSIRDELGGAARAGLTAASETEGEAPEGEAPDELTREEVKSA